MIGKLIMDTRNTYDISQQRLSNGLCSPGMLRKYENGTIRIEKLLADALLQRMGKSTDKYDIILDQAEYNLAAERAYIQELIYSGELCLAEKRLENYNKLPNADKPLHLQFVCLQQAELSRRQKRPLAEQEQIVLNGLSQTIPEKITIRLLQTRLFSVMELLLLERYAILQEERGEEETAAQWYQQIMNYLNQKGKGYIKYDLADKVKLYPIMAYKLADYYAKRSLYKFALQAIETGCQMLTDSKWQSALFIKIEELKFQVLQCCEKEIPAWEKNGLELIKQAIGKETEKWQENWYPKYKENFLHSINSLIKERRLAHGWSEEKLACNICDVRTIKRIENKGQTPQIKIRTALLKKLGLSTSMYDGILATGIYLDFCTAANMNSKVYHGDIAEAEQIYKELAHRMPAAQVTNHQFIRYWNTQINYSEKKISLEEYHKGLWELLNETLPAKTDDKKGNCTLLRNERTIFGDLSWTVEKTDTWNTEAMLINQYKRLDDKAMKSFFTYFYTIISYCLGKIARYKQDFDSAEFYIDTVLEQMFFLGEDILWGRLLFLKYLIEKEKSEYCGEEQIKEEALKWLRYSYAVNRLYIKDDVFLNWMENYFSRHDLDKEEILKGLIED